jgi:hypothetical protein
MSDLIAGMFKLACVALIGGAVYVAPATAILLLLPSLALTVGGVEEAMEGLFGDDGLYPIFLPNEKE